MRRSAATIGWRRTKRDDIKVLADLNTISREEVAQDPGGRRGDHPGGA